MIFHCTKALATKLTNVSSVQIEDTNRLGSWHAHLHIIDRRQCVMFCHNETRFVLFQAGLRKEQFNNLGQVHKELYQNALISLGVSETNLKRVELALGPAMFDTATDRSVLGTLNQSRSDFDCYIPRFSNILEIDPIDAARWLNERPMNARGVLLWPAKLMLEFVSIL